MKTIFLSISGLLLMVFSLQAQNPVIKTKNQSGKPNILIILADDMGQGDMGFLGSKKLKTPNLDALASNGVYCKNAYVTASVCAPSRAGLLTGRQPQRFGFENNLTKWNKRLPNTHESHGLTPGEYTIADHLKNAGYKTALIGKWHLGDSEVHHPNNRGFDYFCGMSGGGHKYFPEKGKSTIQRNGIFVHEFSSPYLTDFFTDEGVKWIKDQKENPWFLFMSYNAPHTPLQAKQEDLALFSNIKDKGRRTYAAMVYRLDQGVGRLVKTLKEQGQLENTLIVFLSDNGGATTNHSWRGEFSGSKGNMREGGIHIPMFWYWKGVLQAGKTDAVISSLDLLPTFLSVAQADPIKAFDGYGKKKHPRVYDGYNILPVLKGEEIPKTRRLFWRLQGQSCVLNGEDKFIRLTHRPAQYFRPFEDVGERNDLSEKNKDTYLKLYKILLDWESGLPTFPHFYTAPYWMKVSAENYDEYIPVPEPE